MPLGRFGKEAPRGGPKGGTQRRPPGEEAHMRSICALSGCLGGLPGGLLQAPWGVPGGIERTGWGVSCDTTLSLAPLRTPPKRWTYKETCAFIMCISYVRLLCAFHMCINMCKKYVRIQLIMNPIDYELSVFCFPCLFVCFYVYLCSGFSLLYMFLFF